MKRRLTKEDISAANVEPRRPGDALLRQFVLAVETGKVPDKTILDALAKRLRPVIDGKQSADQALDLKRPRGRRAVALTAKEADRKSEAAAHVKFRMLQFGESKRRAAEELVGDLKMGRTAILKAFEGYERDKVAPYIFGILVRHLATTPKADEKAPRK